MASGCAFCEIVAGELDAEVVFSDEETVAFLDRRPLFPGHVLLVPRDHHATIADLPSARVGRFFTNGRRLAIAVREAMAGGSDVVLQNAEALLAVFDEPRRKGWLAEAMARRWPRPPVTATRCGPG